MSQIDFWVLGLTLLAIISYGLYKSRSSKTLDGYFRSDRSMPWFLILLSIMGTQASAITFLSGPGQAYSDGMRFVQYYFGLPLAMVVIAVFFVPVFHRLNVYTAYEYLEQRFDLRMRLLTSILFLVSRGLSTGISIYAPSLILSALLGWDIYWTNAIMGGLLIIYTVSGGARAVAYTQQVQLFIIFGGLILSGILVVNMLPDGVGFTDALHLSGSLGRMNIITSGFDASGHFKWDDKYNIFSGLIGGFFLALSYFGTDQSQVGRYLTAKNMHQSRMGLIMNGFVKVPMQFFILLLGVLVFAFYQFSSAPVYFNHSVRARMMQSSGATVADSLERNYDALNALRQTEAQHYAQALSNHNNAQREASLLALQHMQMRGDTLRRAYKAEIKKALPGTDTNDTNYVFLQFVMDHLPVGLVGLLVAIIFLAAWGSIAAALNSLASSSMIDLHQRLRKAPMQDAEAYRWSQAYTLIWGVF